MRYSVFALYYQETGRAGNMKHSLIYVVLGTMLLIGSFTFVSNGWTDERDVLSFVSTTDEHRPIILMNIQGEVLQKLKTEPGQPATFTWSPDRGSIAYEACRNGICEIHLMQISTNVRRNKHRELTFDGGDNRMPAWSPNGKWIAFTSEPAGDRDIYKMDVNGENVKQLTKQRKCSQPVWSPDSRWIAFASHSTLFVMDAEGKNVRQLGKAGTVFFNCTWSPDSKQIAFISGSIEDGIVIFRIDVINVDGQNMRQLTKSEEGTSIRELAWSPSGKWIAYIVTQLPNGPIKQIFANAVIHIVDTAEGEQVETIEATKGMGARYLSWVPPTSLPVSPSAEKQMTFWGRIKQNHK